MTTRLQEEVRQGVGRVIGLQLVFTLFLVLSVALSVGYYAISTRLDYKSNLIGTRISAEISAISSSLEALAQSPLLWTALTDTTDRDAYLTPLLESLNRSDAFRLAVLDYQGRPFALPADSRLDVEDYQRIAKARQEVPRIRFDVINKPGAGDQVLIQLPIVSPMSQSVVGHAVGLYGIDRTLRQLQLGYDTQVVVSFTDSLAMVKPGQEFLQLASSKRESVVTPTGEFTFYVQVAESYQRVVLVFVLLTAAILLVGLYIRGLGRRWAAAFSERTLARLESLLSLSRRIVRGEKVAMPDVVGSDEISEIQLTLGKLLTHQASTLDQLKTAARVFQTAGEAILVTDQQGLIVDVNPALLEITRYAKDELIGQQAGKLYRGNEQHPGDDRIVTALAAEGSWRGETVFYDRSGQAIPAQLAVSRVFDTEGLERGQVAVFTDIREIKVAEAKLRDLAYRDPLTGLPNYRAFSELVQSRLSQEDAHTRPFLLIFLDLDRLKQINDLHGHEKGDEMIRAAAKHFTEALPPGHVLCRRSGDEFLALVDFSDEEERDRIQEMLDKRLCRFSVSIDSEDSAAAASAGVSVFPHHGASFKLLLQQADAALFEVKRGRAASKVAWYSDRLGEKMARRLAIETSLPRAIQSRLIVPHYQPEVEIPTGRIVGFEALARWQDPQLGRVAPDEFIPIAEESQLIGALTQSILHQALTDLPALRLAHPGCTVAVNISPRLFANRRIVEMLTDFAEPDDDVLSGLVVEVTESEFSLQMNTLVTQLQTLRGLGVKIAIDDFGKGYSSLSRLSNMPLDKLKIDSSFVAGLGNSVNLNIVDVILALARALHLSVTAEGVETQQQMNALIAAGCRCAQGWHFARAMPLEEALRLPSPILPEVTPS